MRHLKRYFLPILAVTSFILSASFASPVSAVDLGPNVHPIWANANPLCSFHNRASNTWGDNSFSNNSTGTTSTYSFDLVNCDYPTGLNTVKTYAVYSFRFDNFAYDNSADSGWLASKIRAVSGSANWGVVGQTVSSTGATGWQLDLYLYSENASNGGTFQIYNPLNDLEIFYLKPQERITFVGASYWQVTTDTDFEYDYTDLITAINSNLGTANGHLYGIRNNVNNIHDKVVTIRDTVNGISTKMDDLKSVQEQANQDANDRYQDEKDTIDNNASDAQDTANNADFSFTVGNPLTTWFGLFTGDNCVNIPTIASWIHSNETSVCSPWSSSVRDVTTPIISVLSGTILFGFIVRWLNGSSFNESIEVG